MNLVALELQINPLSPADDNQPLKEDKEKEKKHVVDEAFIKNDSRKALELQINPTSPGEDNQPLEKEKEKETRQVLGEAFIKYNSRKALELQIIPTSPHDDCLLLKEKEGKETKQGLGSAFIDNKSVVERILEQETDQELHEAPDTINHQRLRENPRTPQRRAHLKKLDGSPTIFPWLIKTPGKDRTKKLVHYAGPGPNAGPNVVEGPTTHASSKPPPSPQCVLQRRKVCSLPRRRKSASLRVDLDKSQPKIDSMCEKKRPVSNMSPEVAQLQLCGTRSKTGF